MVIMRPQRKCVWHDIMIALLFASILLGCSRQTDPGVDHTSGIKEGTMTLTQQPAQSQNIPNMDLHVPDTIETATFGLG